jgi:hypothetical protein
MLEEVVSLPLLLDPCELISCSRVDHIGGACRFDHMSLLEAVIGRQATGTALVSWLLRVEVLACTVVRELWEGGFRFSSLVPQSNRRGLQLGHGCLSSRG